MFTLLLSKFRNNQTIRRFASGELTAPEFTKCYNLRCVALRIIRNMSQPMICPTCSLLLCEGPPVLLSSCPPVILSSCPPVLLSSCHPVILSPCTFFCLSFCPLAINSLCPLAFLSLFTPFLWSSCPHLCMSSSLLYIERENDQSQEIVRFARFYATFISFGTH